MEIVFVNKKMVKANKPLKMAQKAAKKHYKRVRKIMAPKLKINTTVSILDSSYVSLAEECNSKSQVRIPSSAEELIRVVRESKLTGLSGNGYATADKLDAYRMSSNGPKTLIVNAVECDPGLIHDKWIYHNKTEEVENGIKALKQVFHFNESILVTKELPRQMDIIKVVQVPNKYPMGYEKKIISSLFGVELSKQEIPAQQGYLILNLQTVMQIGQLVCGKENVDSRILTVADFTTGKAVVVNAPYGMKVSEVYEKAFSKTPSQKLYAGGGMMCGHIADLDESVTESTNLIANSYTTLYEEAGNCRNCGACSSNCPAGVKVHKIVQTYEKGGADVAQFNPELCIGCGACTYVCRAGKNAQYFIAKANGKVK